MEKSFLLRIGSNAEKQYVKKMGSLFSGLVVRANYFESAPGMLSALFLKFDSLNPSKGFIIDPVTYVFMLDSKYIRSWQKINGEKSEEKIRKDLHIDVSENVPNEWVRTIQDPTEKQKNKVEIYNIKKAYRKLADSYFTPNMAHEIGKRSLVKEDFSEQDIREFVMKVINYQVQAISTRYDTAKYSDFKAIVPRPLMILSPYFLIRNQSDLDFMERIWKRFDSQYTRDDGAIVVHCAAEFFEINYRSILEVVAKLSKKNIFLWINKFDEKKVSSTQLDGYIKFVSSAYDQGISVTNLYAGGLSSFLFPFGLTGMVNNIGYGLQRDAEPVQGGIPTAQFYIPKLHIRAQVLATYDLLVKNELGGTAKDFYRNVCSCPICKKGIREELSDFISFYGEADYPKSNSESSRKYPTSKALKRCFFHFLFSRLKEYKWAIKASKQEAIDLLDSEIALWRTDKDHLQRMRDALDAIAK